MNVAPQFGKHEEIVVRLPDDLSRAIDRFIGERDGHESRPQAVISVLREWAHAKGYLSEPGAEGIRPEDLNAENDG